MNDADLLEELATLDEVEARIPTSSEHDAGVVPTWCELVLTIKRNAEPYSDGPGEYPISTRMGLRRHDGELIIQVLHDVLHPNQPTHAGEALWDELDMVVDRIQARVTKGKEPRQKDVGQAQGLAMALAILDSPLEPDIEEVRAVAMERWDVRHGISGVG